MVLEVPYAHCPRCPRNLKERRNSIKDCPSTRLNHATWRRIYSEGILFGLAREKSAVHAAFPYCDKAVKNKNRYSALLSLDYIPDLSNFVCRVPGKRKRNRKRGRDLAQREPRPQTIPPSESGGTNVLETPSRSESAHGTCADHQARLDHAND